MMKKKYKSDLSIKGVVSYLIRYCLLLLSISPSYGQRSGKWGDQGDGTFRNPVIAGDYSDPDPIRVGDDYYLVCSTFESSPGVTVLHSKDLLNWTPVSAVLSDLAAFDPGFGLSGSKRYNGGVYAPTIHYRNGLFYVYVNLKEDGFFFATSKDARGPWMVKRLLDKNGRPLRIKGWTDPCPFWDDDGKAYLVSSHPGSRFWYSYLFEMSPDGSRLLDADSAHMANNGIIYQYPAGGTLISPYHSSEGNRVFKRNGYYYLLHIEFLDQGNGSGTYILRSKDLYGTKADGTPGTPGSPGSYDIYRTTKNFGNKYPQTLPGQGGFVTTPDGRWFWMAQFNTYGSDGRTPNLLPVTWLEDWPVIGVHPKGRYGDMAWQLPKPIPGFTPGHPQGSDEFQSRRLKPIWQWNHQPVDSKWSLSERKGWLRLYASKPSGKGGFFNALNTIDQRHLRSDSAVVTIKLDVSQLRSGQIAGLVHFNGGKNFALLGVRQDGAKRDLVFLKNNEMLDEKVSDIGDADIIYLRSTVGFDDLANFWYSTDGETFYRTTYTYKLLNGNYRGDMVGITTWNDQSGTGSIDVDWFHYEISNR